MIQFLRVCHALCLVLILVACALPAARKDFDIVLQIPSVQYVGFRPVKFSLSQAGKALLVKEVSITGQMTHAGMTPVLAKAKPLGAGVYQVENYHFNMAGDWVLQLEINQAGKRLQADIPLIVNP